MGLSRRFLFCWIRCGWAWIGLSAATLGAVAVSAQDLPSAAVAVAEAPDEGDTGQSESIDEAAGAVAYQGHYKIPYKLTFKVPLHELLFDAKSPRGSVAEESSVPQHEWYSAKVKQKWGSWGVPVRRFDCPPQVLAKPVEWRRERVIAAATRFIGYEYQHHHVPDWDPPAGWPWKRCCAGRSHESAVHLRRAPCPDDRSPGRSRRRVVRDARQGARAGGPPLHFEHRSDEGHARHHVGGPLRREPRRRAAGDRFNRRPDQGFKRPCDPLRNPPSSVQGGELVSPLFFPRPPLGEVSGTISGTPSPLAEPRGAWDRSRAEGCSRVGAATHA